MSLASIFTLHNIALILISVGLGVTFHVILRGADARKKRGRGQHGAAAK